VEEIAHVALAYFCSSPGIAKVM